MSLGSLTVVGTGFMGAGHMTAQARGHIEAADKLFYLGGDPATRRWLQGLNPTAESLYDAYQVGVSRRLAYESMVERMLSGVRQGQKVCTAFYGHPGVFVDPSHEAIALARAEGYAAEMLPGVSAEDCLYADVGIDPAESGCQSYEATYFLARAPHFDPRSALILWQVGGVGVTTYEAEALWSESGLRVLVDLLGRHYPVDHRVVLYEASIFAVCEPQVDRVALSDVPASAVNMRTTMYVPPVGRAPIDRSIAERLSIEVGSGAFQAATQAAETPDHNRGEGSLVVVGTGYHVAGQITAEAEAHIGLADEVFFLVSDPATATHIKNLNPSAASLHDCYAEGRHGAQAHEEMVRRITSAVRKGHQVCAAFTGHPAVFVGPSHESIRRLRAEGHRATMLPGISALDCLFSDLSLDPGKRGCQVYEATDFLLRPRTIEVATPLIFLQVGAIGLTSYRVGSAGDADGFQLLIERLRGLYPADHEVVVYETAQLPIQQPRVDRVPLGDADEVALSVYSTLYVPPCGSLDLSKEMVGRLGLEAFFGLSPSEPMG